MPVGKLAYVSMFIRRLMGLVMQDYKKGPELERRMEGVRLYVLSLSNSVLKWDMRLTPCTNHVTLLIGAKYEQCSLAPNSLHPPI